MFNISKKGLKYKQQRVLRVITKFKSGYTTGSGFFISKDGKFLTCFHVAFGTELRNVRNNPQFISLVGTDEHSKLEQFYKNNIIAIEIEFPDGSIKDLELEKFDEKYDIALLKLKDEDFKTQFLKTDYKTSLGRGDIIFFCGFQFAVGYNNKKYPFAINTGVVSTFPETVVGGDKYKHIQINSINLGGNSGAPLFRKNSNRVIGIINGNMNWGSDNLVFMDNSGQYVKNSLRTPLSIAYATSIKFLKEKTDIFN